MERAIATFAIIHFLMIGASHFVQPQAWAEFFSRLHAQGRAGAFLNGLLTLLMGSMIVAFHNVWEGIPLVLTLIGWAFLIKSTAIFLYPDWNLRSMAQAPQASDVKFRIGGALMFSVALILLLGVALGAYEPLSTEAIH